MKTGAEMGWAALPDGKLIEAAEAAAFDVLVTADRNIRFQQNLLDCTISFRGSARKPLRGSS